MVTTRAMLGVLALIPAAVLVGAGLFGLDRPDWLVHPALVMGGVLVAVAMNALGVLALRGQVSDGVLRGTVDLRYAGRGANVAVAALGAALLAVILAYLLLENAAPH